MKRVIVSLLMVFVLALSLSITQAKPAQVTLANAFFAEQIPAGAGIYMAIRTDDAYIDELDGILSKITTYLTSIDVPVPPDFGMRQLLDMAFMSSSPPMDFTNDTRPWLGSSAAWAVYFNESGFIDNLMVIIDHSNRELAEAMIENLNQAEVTVSVEGDFKVYSYDSGLSAITINDDAIYITGGENSTPFTGVTGDVLSNDLNFQRAVGALPAPSYNILFVVETATLVTLADNNRQSTGDFIRAVAPDAYTAIGATIVNGISPTLDIAQVGLPTEIVSLINTPIDPVFAQNIPANATGVIHGTNLIAPYNALIDLVSVQTGQDLRAQLDQAQAIFGVDVINLLLSGDFAMYFTYKTDMFEAVINEQIESLDVNPYGAPPDFFKLLEFGYIFEISNPADAQALVDQVANLYAMLGASTAGMTLSREEIGGGNALVISTQVTSESTLDLVIGANDRVMVMGTRESATAILNGDGGFDSNTFYQNSLRYTLPTMTHYWFLDRNSVVAIGLLALTGPIIGGVFENIFDEFNNTPTLTPEEIERRNEIIREQTRQTLLATLDFQAQLNQFAQLLDNASVSVSSKEGILFVRAVITLSE